MNKVGKFSTLMLILLWVFAFVTSCEKAEDQIKEETVKDADGNVYKTVKIGDQVWMAENLRTTKYNDGTQMNNVTENEQWVKLTTGAYCNYDNLESNSAIYGRLYNWYAVNTGKLAPIGWHVPTKEDWMILVKYLIANGYNYDGTLSENKFAKSMASTTGWGISKKIGTPGNDSSSNNSTGFSALPGGSRYDESGEYWRAGDGVYWWSSTELDYEYAYFLSINSSECDLGDNEPHFYYSYEKRSGFSVRLIKD